jgi:hypothetical protein
VLQSILDVLCPSMNVYVSFWCLQASAACAARLPNGRLVSIDAQTLPYLTSILQSKLAQVCAPPQACLWLLPGPRHTFTSCRMNVLGHWHTGHLHDLCAVLHPVTPPPADWLAPCRLSLLQLHPASSLPQELVPEHMASGWACHSHQHCCLDSQVCMGSSNV